MINLQQGGHWAEADIGTNAINCHRGVTTGPNPCCRAFLQRSAAMDLCGHSDLASHRW
jgi:hypothetical protein